MKPTLKVGDKVIIRRDLPLFPNSEIPFGVNDYMMDYRGKEAVIERVEADARSVKDYPDYPNFDGARYRLDIDDKKWSWSNVMFENQNTVITNKEEEILLCCTCF